MNKLQSMVSVIMGVNRDDGNLLYSIESILRQTHNDLEFIIVNDGSSEEVKGLVSEILDDRIILINSFTWKHLYFRRIIVSMMDR